MKKLDVSFVLLGVGTTFINIDIYGFYAFSNDFFEKRFKFDEVQANHLTIVVYGLPLILVPIFGYTADKIGHRITKILIATLILLIAHILFLIIPAKDKSYLGLIPVSLIGTAYSIYVVALWTLIPLIVKLRMLGTAYSIMYGARAIGLGGGQIVISSITRQQDEEEEYYWAFVFFIMNAIISFFGILAVFTIDGISNRRPLKKQSFLKSTSDNNSK